MKRDFISFLWIEPSSVSHLSWVFWSKVYLKCVQNMYTPDQEAVKIKEQLWSEGGARLGPGVYDLGLLWPCDLVLVTFPSLTVGWNARKVTLGTQIMTGKYLSTAPRSPEVWRGRERGGGFRASASVSGCTLCEQEGGVGLPGPVLGLFLAAPASVAAGLVQCIRSENARHHLVCRRAVIVWDVCLPQPPPDSHVEFLTPKVWKANLAFPK